MKSFQVNLGKNSYPIYISDNGWNELDRALSPLKGQRILLISDQHVDSLYGKELRSILESMGYRLSSATVAPGESSKSLSTAEVLYTKALKAGLDRSSGIIALGGGVVGDLAGFVAATYMRGIDYIQLPTSLLAQVDSSVGGKVAVNHPMAKNIIGAFHQPRAVYINVETLRTLPEREFSTGMAELIKYGFIWDSDFLKWTEEHLSDLLSLQKDILVEAVYRCCRIKARVVETDERESGLRAILNFGHTIGHAIEALTGFSRYTHGEAVALGMVYESRLACEMGLVDRAFIDRLISLLEKAGLPTDLPPLNRQALVELMTHDKKNSQGKIVFVLPTGSGKVEIFKDVEPALILKVLEV